MKITEDRKEVGSPVLLKDAPVNTLLRGRNSSALMIKLPSGVLRFGKDCIAWYSHKESSDWIVERTPSGTKVTIEQENL